MLILLENPKWVSHSKSAFGKSFKIVLAAKLHLISLCSLTAPEQVRAGKLLLIHMHTQTHTSTYRHSHTHCRLDHFMVKVKIILTDIQAFGGKN
jgi:hypothetical protein